MKLQQEARHAVLLWRADNVDRERKEHLWNFHLKGEQADCRQAKENINYCYIFREDQDQYHFL